ncbi:MAG: hypothetical protein OEO83_05790 [Alphaproteobacteria bacterium]|nr:hypothetical protein [Alphaproteobacteria bacterium]
MNKFKTTCIYTGVAMTLSFLGAQSSLAEALNSEQIKKLLVGNTLYVKGRNASNMPTDVWLYFGGDGTLKRRMEWEGRRRFIEREFESSWKINNDATYCYKNTTGAKLCLGNVRVESDTVSVERTLDGEKDGERKYKLLKGNPKSL